MFPPQSCVNILFYKTLVPIQVQFKVEFKQVRQHLKYFQDRLQFYSMHLQSVIFRIRTAILEILILSLVYSMMGDTISHLRLFTAGYCIPTVVVFSLTR